MIGVGVGGLEEEMIMEVENAQKQVKRITAHGLYFCIFVENKHEMNLHLHFDYDGNLTPSSIIEITWEDFVFHFNTNFPSSNTRSRWLKNFEWFLEEFRRDICKGFVVWVDGSYVSTKLNPADLDAVFFLDYKISERKTSV